MIHYVLRGSGAFRVGNGSWSAFTLQSALIVPARYSHVVGEATASARLVDAADHCKLVGDGLVNFTAGDGSSDILMVCGAISAAYGGALGLLDLLRDPMVEDFSANRVHRHTFDLMLAEVASPILGTQAMTEALMKQSMITATPAPLAQRHRLAAGRGFAPPPPDARHPGGH